jgi:proteasome lid subunit RPN8/RPN11
MITLNTNQLEAIKQHTLSCYPEEACGCITSEDYIPMINVANNKLTSFKMDMLEYRKQKDVIAIYHSHVRQPELSYFKLEAYDPRTPSLVDITTSKATGIPFLISATDGENVMPCLQYPRDQYASLYGRQFAFYINDCLTLMIDYYLQKYGIVIKEHDASFDWYNDLEQPYYETYYRDWDFYEVQRTEAQVGDVVLMSIRGTANHLGVLVEDNQVLHHMVSQPSCLTSLARLETFLYKIIRHKDKP